MSKVKVVLNEIVDVDVEYVSLVRHAANRSPFKIIKSEGSNMIDLKKLFSKAQEETDKAPELVAVFTGAAVAARQELESLNMPVIKDEVKDGVNVITLVEALPEDMVVLKFDETTAVGVANISKTFTEWPDGNTFVENMQQAGFYPTLHMAADVMISTIHNIVEAASGQAPAAEVKQVLDDFTSYVTRLLTAIPVAAYKFEGLKADTLKTDEGVTVAGGDAETGTTETKKTETGEAGKAQAEGADEAVVKTEETLVGVTVEDLKKISDEILGITTKLDAQSQVQKSEATALADKIDALGVRLTEAEVTVAGITPLRETAEDVLHKQEETASVFDSALKFS